MSNINPNDWEKYDEKAKRKKIKKKKINKKKGSFRPKKQSDYRKQSKKR